MAHLDHGKRCERIQLIWNDHLKFTLDKHLTLRNLRLVDVDNDADEPLDGDDSSPYAILDREFALLSESLALLLPLIESTLVQR
jgi:DNA recombination-dependent growth factor C